MSWRWDGCSRKGPDGSEIDLADGAATATAPDSEAYPASQRPGRVLSSWFQTRSRTPLTCRVDGRMQSAIRVPHAGDESSHRVRRWAHTRSRASARGPLAAILRGNPIGVPVRGRVPAVTPARPATAYGMTHAARPPSRPARASMPVGWSRACGGPGLAVASGTAHRSGERGWIRSGRLGRRRLEVPRPRGTTS